MPSESIKGYGEIEYRDLPRGYVKITNSFYKDYLIKDSFPYVGVRVCHVAMVDPLHAALDEIVEKSKVFPEFEYIEHLSLYCPRHMWRRKSKPLSRHAYALAFDINPWENMPGEPGAIPDHIVEVFKRHGFRWGGNFMYRDDMHFELIL